MSGSKLTEVTVAHPTFWYIDAEGTQRMALKGAVIDVNDEDLARGEKYSAFVDPDAPAAAEPDGSGLADVEDKPASDKVDDVKAWVGSDPAKAQEALAAELGKDEGDQRSTLVEHLEKLLAGGSA